GAVAITTLIRRAVRRSFVARVATLEAMPWALRLAIICTGLAWGLGAMLVAPSITLAQLALVMIVLCGLSAAATSTLVADPPAFRGFIAALLVPLALGILATGVHRDQIIAVILVTTFGLG